ncbi:hypothetical protein F5Y04DRAFT_270178 [Hypomontagnella monticulosa]|nr:hypothetical protein F5Y04DRAFT_270178 [Hypomontagnella monticulosa]
MRIAKSNQGSRYRLDIPKEFTKPKLSPVREDGQDRSLLCNRQKDIMTQVLSPAISLFGLDGSGNLPLQRSPSPKGLPIYSLPPIEPIETIQWDKDELLALSDSVRAQLRRQRKGGPDVQKLYKFLEVASRDEYRPRGRPTLDIETIEHARLDKLISDMLQLAEHMKLKLRAVATTQANRGDPRAGELPPECAVNVARAKALRRAWRRRFRERYFMIDQHRYAVLVRCGRLRDLSFDGSLAYTSGSWHTRAKNPVPELEGNLDFDPGHWWLNIACAERDGMVASSLEKPSTGRYGRTITVLPLLTGREELVRTDTYKYVREGRAADTHIALISQVGRQIRVLRGYRLKSILAPEAGVRYDGLFTLRQYGCKLDSKTNMYRIELTLERVPDQKTSPEELKSIPRPSQLDDWNLYEKLEGDKIKLLQGEASYLEWKLKRQEEKLDREDWRRARLFKASFSR